MNTAIFYKPALEGVIRFDKRVRVNEAMWLYALSENGGLVAYAGYQSGKLYLADLTDDSTIEIDAPLLHAKTAMTWSPDNDHFAVLNFEECLIISASQRKCVKQIPRPAFARFGHSAIFSGDGGRLFIEDAVRKDTIIIDISLTDLQSHGLSMPNRGGTVQHALSGRFQQFDNVLYCTVAVYSQQLRS